MSIALNKVSDADLALFQQVKDHAPIQASEFDLLVMDLFYFDWYYDYSDDPRVYKAGVAAEEKLRLKVIDASVKYPVFHGILDAWKSREKRGAWFDKQPIVQQQRLINKVETNGHVRAMCDHHSPDFILEMKLRVIEFARLIGKLPVDSRNRFIMTPTAPSTDVLRRALVPEAWYGTTIYEPLQQEVTEYFSKKAQSLADAVAFLGKYNLRIVNEAGDLFDIRISKVTDRMFSPGFKLQGREILSVVMIRKNGEYRWYQFFL